MYQLAYARRAGVDGLPGAEPNLFFLSPALGRSVESGAVEDVLFIRDEKANLAWAIERSIESPVEQPNTRTDSVTATPDPPHWIPLLPVQIAIAQNRIVSRLQRGAVLQPDGTQEVHHAQGRVLNLANPLVLYDEEIPREGIRVTRHYQMARWIDGSTWAWVPHRKRVDRGEGSSGLQFDSVTPQ
jgi:hypothetical protein